LDALTVRRVAEEVGTTTRAVYSSLGSKDALLIALGRRAFDLLGQRVTAVPRSGDPAGDLVAAGTMGFRRWVLDHPGLFRVGFQHQMAISQDVWSRVETSAERALDILRDLIRRVDQAGGLGGRTVSEATVQFHCLCEGLALMDLRGGLNVTGEDTTPMWADALRSLLGGWQLAAPQTSR
jgi:AcrR family transcriptional regulator